ncbi:solute carrier family 22 member 15 [Hydra vulgaris]|uniref:solute carrier family 22 member 15 n=1 Tax=Hydra vulgaris TaxID=6087 RepID=UPI0002B4576E|nr:solute carrier family 22 member 15-like [Hydra vulgaris]XP_047136429.1 solute carrier family 22 member 15-like [Hydra vulgaris]XP_047136479.1 solute carrier family 22 member 15-like [Hydra vulgaris]
MRNLNNIDETLPFIGELGLYQIIVIAIFCLITIPGTFQSLIIYFVAANPAWKCVENSTICKLVGTFESGDKNYTMRCNMPRSEWKFVEEYEYSIVTQFGLFCENESLIFVSHSLLFAGSAVGSLICGWLADKYGRRQLLIPCNIVVISVAFVSAFSPTYWLFACSRFVVGFFGGTTLAIMFILSSELVGSRYRPTAGIVLWFFFTFALVMLGLVAMKVRKWKMLMIVSTAPYFLVIPLLFFIPESLRWMHLNRKMEQLHRDIQRIAKINGKEPLLIELSPLNEKELSVKPWMLFSTKKMAFTTLSIGFAWFINGLVYYGLSVAVDNLSNHFYRNYILSSLIELPAILIGILGATYVGRKCTVVYPMLLAGLLCALVTVIDEKETRQRFINTRVVLGLFGKFFVTLSYDTIYTWTVELFPTQIRTEALGYVLIASRIGGMFSPWISKWLRVIHWRVPFVMMGVLTIVSALLMHWLPETKEKATLEKLEDSIQVEENKL